MRVSEMAADGPAAKDDEPPLEARAEARVRALGPDLVVSPSQLVARALQLAGVDREDLIDVAGPDGLAAMVALCRAGYERVECARQSTCCGADEHGDLLLIVGPMEAGALAQTVRRTARLLRDDGVLIVQLAGAEAEAVVRPALLSAGFEPIFTLVDRTAGRLVMHKVRRVPFGKTEPLSA